MKLRYLAHAPSASILALLGYVAVSDDESRSSLLA